MANRRFSFLSRQVLKFCRRIDFARHRPTDVRDIPIIINNFNRLDYLKQLIGRLKTDGYRNIQIIDNASTFRPLIEFYETECALKVHRLGLNGGHLSLWNSSVWDEIKDQFYVYTDSDVVPDAGTPPDYLQVFMQALKQNPLLDKVGFSLRVDDLPPCYSRRDDVKTHENQFWRRVNASGFYEASVDTTFALYRPGCRGGPELRAWRSPEPYLARHLPWYENSSHLTPEQKYYYEKTSTIVHWGKEE